MADDPRAQMLIAGWAEESAQLRAWLQKITEGRGRYSLDRLEHAHNTIEDMKDCARRALLGETVDDGE